MSKLTQLSERFLRSAEVESQTPITVGIRPSEGPCLAPQPDVAGLIALGKLVELRRRSISMAPDQLSEQVSLSQMEILRLEEGVVGPRVLERLPSIAQALHLPESPLLELAGVKPDTTDRVRQAANAFVARTVYLVKPTPNESEALEEFVRALDSE